MIRGAILFKMLLGCVVHHSGLVKGVDDLDPLSWVSQDVLLLVFVLNVESRHPKAIRSRQSRPHKSILLTLGGFVEVEAGLPTKTFARHNSTPTHTALDRLEYAIEDVTATIDDGQIALF